MKIWNWPRDRRKIESFFARVGKPSPEVERSVDRIIEDVRRRGDRAVAELTAKFDGVKLRPADFDVPLEKLAAAWDAISPRLRRALRTAKRRIESFHRTQRLKGWTLREPGFGRIDQRVLPLHRVAVYVPSAQAPLVSTVLMNVIPARVAGVPEIILVSPPTKTGWPDTGILAAAHLVGVNRVLRIGGSPAMPALAFGTKTIPRVDKVVGPSNIYVSTAKQKLYGHFDIEGLAGPSEVMIIADRRARLDWVAADLLAQAEHDGDNPTGAVLIGGGEARARALISEVKRQLSLLPRQKLAARSIRQYGYIILVRSAADAVALANLKAPEHLEIQAAGARGLAANVYNAGAIFLGPWTPEPVGDYVAGPNHTLPTGGTSRFFSPLSVWSFYKTSHTIEATQAGFKTLADDILTLAEAEQLTAHAEAVRIRRR